MRKRYRRTRDIGGAARAAFSLVELVLVTVIIGILAAMAIPRYGNSLAHRRVEAAAHRIAADLTLARRRARLTSASQLVGFDSGAHTYTVAGARDLDHHEDEYVVLLSDDHYQATFGRLELGAATPTEIVFDGYGLPDEGGLIVVESAGYRKGVIVDPETGRATVMEADAAETLALTF